jgi:putative transposase
VRDQAGRSPQHGNAVLGEGMRRLDLMRESKAYQAARKMSRGEPRSPVRKARATEFKGLFEASGFTRHGLQKFAQACRDNCWIKDPAPVQAPVGTEAPRFSEG